MVMKAKIEAWLENKSAEMGFFLVEVEISKKNEISVFIDTEQGIGIQECTQVSRGLSEFLGDAMEKYSLEVSSPGLDRPLKVAAQFAKNLGKNIEIELKDNSIVAGKMTAVTSKDITIEEKTKSKKKEVEPIFKTFSFSEVKEVKVSISFK
ncbi:MAG: ribosome assembly cofactor RimP [Bacteroidetes bacterium HGW-Bacteroidetes-21]|nr:MAG: ribosome assembly cofactor RimP [Bacteroidetes bacterium HGW-Bacteroidetes-21]